MGSSPSKPKPTTLKKQKTRSKNPTISRPTSTPLAPPHLSPLPFRHQSAIARPTAEQEVAARVAHFASRGSAPVGRRGEEAASVSAQHYRLLKEGARAVAQSQHRPARQVISAGSGSGGGDERKPGKGKEKVPYQFKPLNEIGAARSTIPAKGKSKSNVVK